MKKTLLREPSQSNGKGSRGAEKPSGAKREGFAELGSKTQKGEPRGHLLGPKINDRGGKPPRRGEALT